MVAAAATAAEVAVTVAVGAHMVAAVTAAVVAITAAVAAAASVSEWAAVAAVAGGVAAVAAVAEAIGAGVAAIESGAVINTLFCRVRQKPYCYPGCPIPAGD